MAKCEKCGVQVESDDVYTINGKELCENCAMNYKNPSQPCGGGNS